MIEIYILVIVKHDMKDQVPGMDTLQKGLLLASSLEPKVTYSIKHDVVPMTGSEKTAYRRMDELKAIGLARVHRGRFTLNRVVRQPFYILKRLLPSLFALKNARHFGRHYNEYDVSRARKAISEGRLFTLDYPAWELTGMQSPRTLYAYSDDVGGDAGRLKGDLGFSEGRKGSVVLLPKVGDFGSPVERLYLDCVARGGRSLMDAIAIELLHPGRISTKCVFPIDYIRKVQEDLPPGATEK